MDGETQGLQPGHWSIRIRAKSIQNFAVFAVVWVFVAIYWGLPAYAIPTREEIHRSEALGITVYKDSQDTSVFWYVPPVRFYQENGNIVLYRRPRSDRTIYYFYVVPYMTDGMMDLLAGEVPGLRNRSQLRPVTARRFGVQIPHFSAGYLTDEVTDYQYLNQPQLMRIALTGQDAEDFEFLMQVRPGVQLNTVVYYDAERMDKYMEIELSFKEVYEAMRIRASGRYQFSRAEIESAVSDYVGRKYMNIRSKGDLPIPDIVNRVIDECFTPIARYQNWPTPQYPTQPYPSPYPYPVPRPGPGIPGIPSPIPGGGGPFWSPSPYGAWRPWLAMPSGVRALSPGDRERVAQGLLRGIASFLGLAETSPPKDDLDDDLSGPPNLEGAERIELPADLASRRWNDGPSVGAVVGPTLPGPGPGPGPGPTPPTPVPPQPPRPPTPYPPPNPYPGYPPQGDGVEFLFKQELATSDRRFFYRNEHFIDTKEIALVSTYLTFAATPPETQVEVEPIGSTQSFVVDYRVLASNPHRTGVVVGENEQYLLTGVFALFARSKYDRQPEQIRQVRWNSSWPDPGENLYYRVGRGPWVSVKGRAEIRLDSLYRGEVQLYVDRSKIFEKIPEELRKSGFLFLVPPVFRYRDTFPQFSVTLSGRRFRVDRGTRPTTPPAGPVPFPAPGTGGGGSSPNPEPPPERVGPMPVPMPVPEPLGS